MAFKNEDILEVMCEDIGRRESSRPMRHEDFVELWKFEFELPIENEAFEEITDQD